MHIFLLKISGKLRIKNHLKIRKITDVFANHAIVILLSEKSLNLKNQSTKIKPQINGQLSN